MDAIVKALIHVHNEIDPAKEWGKAVKGLALLGNREVAQVWILLANKALTEGDPCKVIITHSKYKILFKRALLETNELSAVENGNADVDSFHTIQKCLQHSFLQKNLPFF